MATDWTVYWLTSGFGLAVIAAAIGLPFCLWRGMLGPLYPAIGARPYVIGYAAGLAGLVLLSFASAYIEFDSRVAAALLQDSKRWTLVPGWTMYISVLSLVAVLPLLGGVGVPATAFLLKRGHLTVRNVVLALAALWLALTVTAWLIPANDWHRTHRFAAFRSIATGIAPAIGLIALPFALGILWATRTFRGRGN